MYFRWNIPCRWHASQLACYRTLCCTLGSETSQSTYSSHSAAENRQQNKRCHKDNNGGNHNKYGCGKGLHSMYLVLESYKYFSRNYPPVGHPLATWAQSLQVIVWAQLWGFPPAILTVGEFHVAGGHAVPPLAEQDIWALLKHKLCACVIVATFCIPEPKIVSMTSAATRITTAVTTIRMVVDSPFMHIIWGRAFKNPYDLIGGRLSQ